MKFQNPIVPGFSPDPSVVLVDDTYFLVTSTFHIFPAIPIYASKDLQKWEHIGNAIDRPGQLDLTYATTTYHPNGPEGAMVTTAGLFAPTIRYHKGVFYIVCTNVTNKEGETKTRNFYISCTNIWENKWSNPIYIDFSGIDPSFFFEDDKVYVQGSFRLHPLKQDSCSIKQFEIDIGTGQSLTDTKVIWEGHARIHSEGPHIYKKDNLYYLLIAEGGTFEHHMLSIARSKNIWGPYESCESNPILTADGTDEYIQGVGHGELFQDTQGKWWAAVLGYRDDHGRFPMGRETFLTPVKWDENEWPILDLPTIDFEREHHASAPNSFSTRKNGRVDDCYLRTPVRNHYEFSGDNQKMSLLASKADLSAQFGTVSFLGKRQRTVEFTSTAILRVNQKYSKRSLHAGLTVYKDDVRHAEILFDYSTSTICFRKSTTDVKDSVVVRSSPFRNIDSVGLRIEATPHVFRFHYRRNEIGNWVLLGSIDGKEMTARDFTGTLIGVFATGRGEGEGSKVDFEGFQTVT